MKPIVATQTLALTAPGDSARDTADLQDEKRWRNRAVVPDADRDLVDALRSRR